MNPLRVLRRRDYRQMPWKNGGGTTCEIAVFPCDANTADFDWRISMAQVVTDGWFSEFLGIDRTLSILEGKGIMLSGAGETETLISPTSGPHSFPADTPAYARLIEDTVMDLNVMTRRKTFRHRVLHLESSAFSERQLTAETTAILCNNSPLLIKAGEVLIQLDPLDSVFLDNSTGSVSIFPKSEQKIYIIEINNNLRHNQVRQPTG